MSFDAYLAILAALAIERIVELGVSRRHARIALGRGGFETGRSHFVALAAFHTAFLFAPAVEVIAFQRQFPGLIGWLALGIALVAQGLRYWAVITLGERWNTRIIVVPGDSPVTTGPYRWIRHPNYLAVIIEMAAVPMIYGCWITAIVFSSLNALLLSIRIPQEERALGAAYAESLAQRPRLIPGL